MRPESAPRPDDQANRLHRTEAVALGTAGLAAAGAALAVLVGDSALAAALGGALFGGLTGGWAGVVLGRRARQDEPQVAYTVVTHERPGWRTVDLRDSRHVRR